MPFGTVIELEDATCGGDLPLRADALWPFRKVCGNGDTTTLRTCWMSCGATVGRGYVDVTGTWLFCGDLDRCADEGPADEGLDNARAGDPPGPGEDGLL